MTSRPSTSPHGPRRATWGCRAAARKGDISALQRFRSVSVPQGTGPQAERASGARKYLPASSQPGTLSPALCKNAATLGTFPRGSLARPF